MSLGEALATFANSMRSQLDLQVEAANLIEFRKNFQDMTNVAFPEPFPELCHSTYVVRHDATFRGCRKQPFLCRSH